MFGIGLGEILLIVIIAIIVIEPKKWPRIAQSAGVLWVKIQHTLQALKKEINDNTHI